MQYCSVAGLKLKLKLFLILFLQTFPIGSSFSLKGVLQLWQLPSQQLAGSADSLPTPQLALGILHDYGCIRALKWCPSGVWQTGDEEEGAGGRTNQVYRAD